MFPNSIFPNMTVDANGITIPFTDLAGLTLSEADPATGDGREVARILTETIATKFQAIPTADRPTKMNATKANLQGIGVNQARQSYTLSFDIATNPSEVSMVAEPV